MNLPCPRQPSHPNLTVPRHPYLGVDLGIEFNLIVHLHSVGILAAEETKQLKRLSVGAMKRRERFPGSQTLPTGGRYLNTMRWSSKSTWTSVLSSTQNSMNTYLGLSYHRVRACCLKRSGGGASQGWERED